MAVSTFSRLSHAAACLQSGAAKDARRILLETLAATRPGDDPRGPVFAAALLKIARTAGQRYASEGKRKSTPRPAPPEFPFQSAAQGIANVLLANHLHGYEEATLLDTGVSTGSGAHIAALLRHMEETQLIARKLTVIAIAPAKGRLLAAQRSVRREAEAIGVELEFIPIAKRLGELDDDDWASLHPVDGPLVANLAFCSHHLAGNLEDGERGERGEGGGGSDGSDGADATGSKDVLLRRLRELRPRALVLSELHADFEAADFSACFARCWRHFGPALRAFGQPHVTATSKQPFQQALAQNIEWVLHSGHLANHAWYEPATAWLRRLRRAGFKVQQPARHEIQQPLDGVTSVSVRNGYLGLDAGRRTLAAIIQAT